METFTPTAALRQQMERLEQALDSLAAQLEQLELLEAHVYPLPAVPQGQEHEPIEQIEVGYLGEAAQPLGPVIPDRGRDAAAL